MRPISLEFNRATLALADQCWPQGFDVDDAAGLATADTYATLRNHVTLTGRMIVWPGASDRTMFADPTVNWAFRAWHDWHHIQAGQPFTYAGETACADLQCRHILDTWGDNAETQQLCRLVRCEVIGQLDYAARHGGFPADQRAFAETYLKG